jgi:hypothetical protein
MATRADLDTPAASTASTRARIAFLLAVAGMLPAVIGAIALLIGRLARPGNELPLESSADYFWIHWLGWSILILMFASIPALLAVPFAGYAAGRHPSRLIRRVSLVLAGAAVMYVAWVAYQRAVAPQRYRERMQELEEQVSRNSPTYSWNANGRLTTRCS